MTCPECKHGKLEIVMDGFVGTVYHTGYHVAGTPLPMRMEQRPFAACNACEFCIEINEGRSIGDGSRARFDSATVHQISKGRKR